MKKEKRYCKCGCGTIIKGHPNKKFVNQKHKDKFWNRENPRGYFKHLNPDMTFGEYSYLAMTEHPLSSDALGQD